MYHPLTAEKSVGINSVSPLENSKIGEKGFLLDPPLRLHWLRTTYIMRTKVGKLVT